MASTAPSRSPIAASSSSPLSDGLRVWSSKVPSKAKTGKYAAVLRPDGQVSVYGPAVWSTPIFNLSAAGSHGAETTARGKEENVLFSSQILDEQDKLATRDYTLVMRDDCNLALAKAPAIVAWQSGKVGKGVHRFLRLDHRGQLAVEDDHGFKTLWTRKHTSKAGDNALILQIDGQAVAYGPRIWSASSSIS
ncbi:hypothetical protein GW17_00023007 [Ensete ventricosum]|nr:hypothetical protein GW17_00023007 [Ensete ventricosum]